MLLWNMYLNWPLSGMDFDFLLLTDPVCVCALVAQSCPIFCDPINYSPLGSSVQTSPDKNTGVGCHPFSRRSSRPRDWTHVFCIGRRVLSHWATREAPKQKHNNGGYDSYFHLRVKKTPATLVSDSETELRIFSGDFWIQLQCPAHPHCRCLYVEDNTWLI